MRRLVVPVFVVMLGLIALGGRVGFGQYDGPPAPPGPNASVAEIVQWKMEFRDWAKRTGRLVKLSGPETAGATIAINGRPVKLPSDTYVESFIVNIECIPGAQCPTPPLYRLQRGNSIISIEANSGRVVELNTAPGEQRAFDFLVPFISEGDEQ